MWGEPPRHISARFGIAALLVVVATMFGASPEVTASDPEPSLVLQTSGGTVRDGSVITTGTTLTTSVGGLLKPGTGSRELRIDLPAGVVYKTGGVTAPEGWAVQYSTNGAGSWVSSEPSPASTVTNVRATNSSVTAGSIGESTQSYTRDVTSNVPTSTFGASTGGDGWDVFFYDNYVLNIFHHDNAIKLDCHLRSAAGNLNGGDRCQGFHPTDSYQADGTGSMFEGYRAGDRSGGWVNGSTGKMYAFTSSTTSNKPGTLCVNLDVTPPTACGFTALSTDTNVDAYEYLSNAEGIGGRLFGIETRNNRLLCFDPETGDACAGSPIALNSTGTNLTPYFHVYALGTKIFATTDTTLYCYEASTLVGCAGSWPVTYASLSWTAKYMPPVAHMNTSGVLDGVCLSNGCLDLSGVKRTGTGWVNPHTITPWGEGGQDTGLTQANPSFSGRYGSYTATAGRAFIPAILHDSVAPVYCFDYATEAACANFDTTPFPDGKGYHLYAVRTDPTNPNCIFWNSNPGYIGLFDAFSGATNCAGSPVITMQPSQFAPRFVCTTSGGIDRWTSIKLTGVTGGTATSRKLTIRKSNGDAIAGWTDVSLDMNVAKDLSSLDVAVSGSRPTFNVAFSDVTGSITAADFQIVYEGRGPELCVDTTLSNAAVSGSPVCPDITGIAGSLAQDVSGSTTSNAPPRSFTISGNAGQCAQNVRYAGPPDKPVDLTCIKSTNDVALTYKAPADDGGSAVRWYELSVDGGTNWTVLSPTLSSGTYAVTVAMATASVGTCKVRAVNVLGDGTSESVTASTINLTYDGNGFGGGSAPVDSTNYANGALATVTGNTGSLTKAGYTFAGWCTTRPEAGEPCSGVARADGDTFAISADTTLFAVWTANTLAVTYDSQEGSAIVSGSTVTGGSIAVSPGSPTRDGYTFAGWFAADTGGNRLDFPYVHGRTADFTLYAQWTANTLTVTYESQGGSAIASSSTTTGASISRSPGSPTRTGYGFRGWFAARTGGHAIVFPYAHGRTSDFVLYAQWAGNAHSITYNGNGQTGGTAPAVGAGVYGSSYTVAANSGALSRAGFSFGGWNTAADGSGTTYGAGVDSFVVSGDLTLYAVWRDATAPLTPGTPDLVTASDSGASSSDDLTKFTSPTISVTSAESGGVVTVKAVKEDELAARFAPRATAGVVTCTMAGSLSGTMCDLVDLGEGTWRVTSTHGDAEGNVSVESAALIVVVDPVPPKVTLSTPSETSSTASISFSVTGNERLDCSTLTNRPGIDFTTGEIVSLGDITQPNGTECRIPATSTARAGGGAVVSTLSTADLFAVADMAGNFQVAVPERSKSVTVLIEDASEKDTSSPIGAQEATPNVVRESAPVAVRGSSARITFTPSVPRASVKSYSYSIDGGKTWKTAKVSVSGNGEMAIKVDGLSVGGSYTIQIRAVLKSGETRTEVTKIFRTKSALPVSGNDASSGLLLSLLSLAAGLVALAVRARMRRH